MAQLFLSCPTCETTFKLEAATLAPAGAVVRCTSCSTRWFAHEDGTEGPILSQDDAPVLETKLNQEEKPFIEEVDIPLVPEIKKTLRPAQLNVVKPIRKMPWSTLLILAACILLLGFFLGRETVLRNLPQTAPLYSALGFNTNLIGVEFQNVTTKRVEDKAADILIIEGKIYNFSTKKAKIPKILLSLRDKAGKEVYAWSTPAPQETLESKASVDFRARLAAPPLEGYDVLIRFAQNKDD